MRATPIRGGQRGYKPIHPNVSSAAGAVNTFSSRSLFKLYFLIAIKQTNHLRVARQIKQTTHLRVAQQRDLRPETSQIPSPRYAMSACSFSAKSCCASLPKRGGPDAPLAVACLIRRRFAFLHWMLSHSSGLHCHCCRDSRSCGAVASPLLPGAVASPSGMGQWRSRTSPGTPAWGIRLPTGLPCANRSCGAVASPLLRRGSGVPSGTGQWRS